MIKKNLLLITSAIGLFFLLLSVIPSTTSARMPRSITYNDTGDQGRVKFSHSIHLSYGNTCGDCHPKIFKKKIGIASREMTMKTLEAGKYCGTCHNGEQGFSVKDDCELCHSH
ncbi:MAG: cytochrome c3 family protein [Nitrospina sp.]|jgi:c(7)-type cytochrome triheme protein|nr:cytochrome c3 family protein [Nitrospina sp.]MBT3509517.1 cytochrome c3 family protein [Nitrospina sp.]MBT3877074.1 cytochrome c3 family protein [Nitrospina sp.]MBT4050047.1 cytochrome c3 family protein [Nitrospina sp.]MBT4558211.1 cytochrome c3 family protein [Nitrospina sp.]